MTLHQRCHRCPNSCSSTTVLLVLFLGYNMHACSMHQADNDCPQELLDSLDRSLNEVEAIQSIYSSPSDEEADEHEAGAVLLDQCIRMVLKSTPEELRQARLLIKDGCNEISKERIPTLAMEIYMLVHAEDDTADTTISNNNNNDNKISACLYFGLGPGYPAHQPVSVTILTAQGLSNSEQQDLVLQLQSVARKLVGSEAIMELVQECQDRLTDLQAETSLQKQMLAEEQQFTKVASEKSSSVMGRRWIWVHHITDRQRKESIVQMACEYELGGYLKAGYPGIIVVEGGIKACDEFVIWIKGNKSRPRGLWTSMGPSRPGRTRNRPTTIAHVLCGLGRRLERPCIGMSGTRIGK